MKLDQGWLWPSEVLGWEVNGRFPRVMDKQNVDFQEGRWGLAAEL